MALTHDKVAHPYKKPSQDFHEFVSAFMVIKRAMMSAV